MLTPECLATRVNGFGLQCRYVNCIT